MMRIVFYSLAVATASLFLLTQYLIFYGTPIERELLFSQKIFYYHVPCAMVLFVAVFVCGISSILYLKRREGRYDDLAAAAGDLAVLFGAIVLATGSIWGRAAWGHWWQWDQRLTTSLLLWMVMVGYVLVRRYGGASAERLAAGLAIFGMADVPLIYFSVYIWKTIHPKATVVPNLQGSMKMTFWLSVLLFFAFSYLLLHLRRGLLRGERLLHQVREGALDAGIIE